MEKGVNTESRGRKVLFCLALFLLAFGLRFFAGGPFFFASIDQGSRNFEVLDSCYHMRRASMTVDDYPKVPFFDTYHYYPDNPTVPWPIGYTLFLATVAKPIDLVCDSTLAVETVIGILPCLIDGLTALLFLLFFLRFVPFQAAWLGALIYAVSFLNIAYSEAGYIDHHYFISFLVACSACLFAYFDARPSVKRGLLAGSVLGGSLFFNVSLIQYVLLFLGALWCALLFARDWRERIKPVAALFAAALCAALLVSFTTPAGRSFQIRYDEISLFHPLLIVFAILGGALGLIWLKAGLLSGRPRLALTAILAAGTILLVAATSEDVIEGARFLLVGNRLNKIQSEEASILGYAPIWHQVFTWFVVFVPLGLFALCRRRRNAFFLAATGLFFLYGTFTGLSHLLYVQYLFPWYGLVVGVGVHEALGLLERRIKVFRFALLVPFVLQAGWVVWTTQLGATDVQVNQRRFDEQTIRALAWLREYTPPTSHHAAGDGEPEYSIFAHRDFGHQIVRTARRPVTTSPFSTPDFVDHMQDYVRLTFGTDEQTAAAMMDKYCSRYLILDGRDTKSADFLISILEGEPDHDAVRAAVTAETINFLFRSNLLIFDGTLNWRTKPSIERFRLIYEGQSKLPVQLATKTGVTTGLYNSFKIFEYVKGARVTGSGYSSNEPVLFQLLLETNTGRRFTYSTAIKADTHGRIAVTLPYATEQDPRSAVRPLLGHYEVTVSSGKTKVPVPEELVSGGGSLVLNR